MCVCVSVLLFLFLYFSSLFISSTLFVFFLFLGTIHKTNSSIIDVLETLGVKIPYNNTNIEEKKLRSTFHTTASNATEMIKFLDSLIDR